LQKKFLYFRLFDAINNGMIFVILQLFATQATALFRRNGLMKPIAK